MAAYAHPRGVAVEGEVGVILGVEEEVSSKTASAASYEDTLAFIEGAGVDAIAPSIGTAHGLYTGVPALNFGLVERLAAQPVPIVIHGGTGLPRGGFPPADRPRRREDQSFHRAQAGLSRGVPQTA